LRRILSRWGGIRGGGGWSIDTNWLLTSCVQLFNLLSDKTVGS